MSKASSTILLAIAIPLFMGGVAAGQQPATAPEVDKCENEVNSQKTANTAFTNSLNKFKEENPPGNAPKPQACVSGTVSWELTSWKMDVPEITMKTVEWKIDIPETKLNEQEWWVKEPIVVCEDKKTGQYPETTCEDTWVEAFGVKTKGIPSCSVSWHDIITTVCWPETRDKRVVLGVPEFTMTTKTMSMDLPQVTMKTREMSLHLPHFQPDAGCIGADCAEKCKEQLNEQIEQSNSARQASIGPAKAEMLKSTTAMFQCQGKSISTQQEFALARYDKFIAVSEATLGAFRAQGLEATEQEKALIKMKEERQKVKEDLDKSIAALLEAEKKTVSALGS